MIDGAVVVDKEAGWTSHDVVARLKRTFGGAKVGHAGTLDPTATGVLLVGLGRVTRLLRYIGSGFKSYEGEIVLGISTTTLDAQGEIVGEYDMSSITAAEVVTAAAGLTGEIDQVPPMVSARSIGGKRLHHLARRGIEVERPATRCTVRRFDATLLPGDDPRRPVVAFEAECSGGTYVRVLADDLGHALGGGAHVRALRRTRVGSFGLDEARRVGDVTIEHVIPVVACLRSMEHVAVDTETVTDVSHGRPIALASLGARSSGPWCLVGPGGDAIAVYELGNDLARPAVVLAPASGAA